MTISTIPSFEVRSLRKQNAGVAGRAGQVTGLSKDKCSCQRVPAYGLLFGF